MWGSFIRRARRREEAIYDAVLHHTTTARVMARSSAEHGLAGCSRTITAKPQAYVDPTGMFRRSRLVKTSPVTVSTEGVDDERRRSIEAPMTTGGSSARTRGHAAACPWHLRG
jgi:hypothetical protein